jgi:xanthine/uracil permease
MQKRVETLQSLSRWDRFITQRAAVIDRYIEAKKKQLTAEQLVRLIKLPILIKGAGTLLQ